MIKLIQKCEDARYSNLLEQALNDLNAKKIVYLLYESNYQGFVDLDVLLKDGRVISYKYSYGSCLACDEWESRGLSDKAIIEEMKKEFTYFANMDSYKKWTRCLPVSR